MRQAEVTAAKTMIERTAETLRASGPTAWPPTPATARPRRWPGWSTSRGSSRTSRCGTNQRARTGPSRAVTSPTTKTPTSILCPAGKSVRKRQRKLSDRWAAHAAISACELSRRPARRLRRLRAEAPVLPSGTRPQNPALDPRSRPRQSSRYRHDRRLRRLTATAEEGRDAVRPPQTHSEARPAAPHEVPTAPGTSSS